MFTYFCLKIIIDYIKMRIYTGLEYCELNYIYKNVDIKVNWINE